MNFGFSELFVIFLITLGPLKTAIVYATMTADADAGIRRSIAIRTVLVATIVSILFVVAGEYLLDVFHISIPALKFGGGIILMLYALEMVLGNKSEEGSNAEVKLSPNVAVFPLAMPLMATPHGLVAIVTLTAAAPGTTEVVYMILAILAVMVFNFFFVLGAHKILSAIGPAALKVVSVIVGLLLVALGIQLMIWGLTDLGLVQELPAESLS
jgi:multiple antibiotic resistance protein